MSWAAGRDARLAEQERFLTARMVSERYSVSSMTLWRWLKNAALGFPMPVYFGSHRYWRLSELDAWEQSRPQPAARGLIQSEVEPTQREQPIAARQQTAPGAYRLVDGGNHETRRG